ncbi:hypothetical protein SAMN02745166_04806 [Prosthecobacter debontii]|uniref:Glycosyl transferase family 2 n=1 Tax=Prosthecobacter debontii TaxID=48467 RepID=A0A1T4Z2W9_9BACT|nr:hypothetical protein [Prosthecobacter debontii]SKB07875.1 hypothetical protein SAMN02745166_04806 [Prosthecobacter debontii]
MNEAQPRPPSHATMHSSHSQALPRVLLTCLYPPDPESKCELFITEALIREYLQQPSDYDLSILIGSAHKSSLELAGDMLQAYPQVPYQLLHFRNSYTGRRAEEIASCKQLLLKATLNQPFDFLLFLDADVWTSIRAVPDWIRSLSEHRNTHYLKIKYSLRDALISPVHTLGAYFHHRDLLVRTNYPECVFVLKPDGSRKGAPDCHLHNHLKRMNCKRLIPADLQTYHFLNESDANMFADDHCKFVPNARQRIESRFAIPDPAAC